MSYEQIKDLPASEFKRLCGVHIATFGKMVEVLKPELVRIGKKGGQPKLNQFAIRNSQLRFVTGI